MTTAIEWTDETWNPLAAFDRESGERGWFCTKVSPGCAKCYAERLNRRLGTGHTYTVPNLEEIEFRLVNLDAPLRWRKPRRVFVNSMTDLFHEAVPDEMIDQVFAVMTLTGGSTFQVLTKRPDRMRAYMEGAKARLEDTVPDVPEIKDPLGRIVAGDWFPPPNVWLGTSVEDQERADHRIPILQRTPAAVRFLSCEPLLGPIDLGYRGAGAFWLNPAGERMRPQPWSRPEIDWVIVGGESGPGARPMHIDWASQIVGQCQNAGVPVFVKQLGSRPVARSRPLQGDPTPIAELPLAHSKGGDPSEWPSTLRVREFPDREEVAR